jgi:hypothetical protein
MGGGRFPWVKVPLWTRGEEGGLSAAVSQMEFMGIYGRREVSLGEGSPK